MQDSENEEGDEKALARAPRSSLGLSSLPPPPVLQPEDSDEPLDLTDGLDAAQTELSPYDVVSKQDLQCLSLLLTQSKKLLKHIAALSDAPDYDTAKALNKACRTLARGREDLRLNAGLPGNRLFLGRASEVGVEIELTLCDAIDALVCKFIESPSQDPRVGVQVSGLLSSALIVLKDDIRAEAEVMRIASIDEEYTDEELRAIAAQSSVRTRYREKKQLTKVQLALKETSAQRKATRDARRAEIKAAGGVRKHVKAQKLKNPTWVER